MGTFDHEIRDLIHTIRYSDENVDMKLVVENFLDHVIDTSFANGSLLDLRSDEAYGDPRVRQRFQEMWSLHIEKGKGYGTEQDTFANLRSTDWIGLPAWKMCLVRASDKWARIQNHIQKGEIPGDSLHNDLRDMAMYLTYADILFDEFFALTVEKVNETMTAIGRENDAEEHLLSRVPQAHVGDTTGV